MLLLECLVELPVLRNVNRSVLVSAFSLGEGRVVCFALWGGGVFGFAE